MTRTNKQILPALHQSGKVKNPDMPEIEQQNYTSTVLKYANLALPFPQLETDAKRVVPAINELYENRAIANPEPPSDQDPLNTVQIGGTVYKVEGGAGGGYTAGAGIYFTGDDNNVINADAGRFSPKYNYFNFYSPYAETASGYEQCWEDSGTTVDGHTVYQSNAGTYLKSSGDSTFTLTVGGYAQFTIYVKQNPATSDHRYIVIGYPDQDIDLENRNYAQSYKGNTSSDYIAYSTGGGYHTYQVMYHKEPYNAPSVSLDLNDGQWVDTGATVDNNTVYKSDAGSYHVDDGQSICALTVEGVTRFTIYLKASSESGYDWAYVGDLDSDVSRFSYKERLSGVTNYTAVTYECSSERHTVQILYAKDYSVNANDDRGYFYYTIDEYAPIPSDDDRAYAYIVLGGLMEPYGEIFNNYESNRALGWYSHAEGSSNVAIGYSSHAEGGDNIATGSYSHAEGSGTYVTGTYAHAEGAWTRSTSEGSHAEGKSTLASGAASHSEGNYTVASGTESHAEGNVTQALGNFSHSEGTHTIAHHTASHAEGWGSEASGIESHAEGNLTKSIGASSHAEGDTTEASGNSSHAEGFLTVASGVRSHAEGHLTIASGSNSHAEGSGDSDEQTTAEGEGSHAEGRFTHATGDYSHTEGYKTIASGLGAHAEGYAGFGGANSTASGIGAHVEGGGGNNVIGNCGHAEGTRNTVYNESGHAEGSGNHIYGNESHIEGSGNTSVGMSSHTEGAGNRNISHNSHVEGAGNKNTTNASFSHTEGSGNTNYGIQAHVEGAGNQVSGEESHVEGAGNRVHGPKTHGEGGGNIAYAMGSHIEGKHNTAVGFGQHAEGIDNCVGTTSTPAQFSYGTTYAVGDIVAVNDLYRPSTYPEDTNKFLFRCITAPGQIQAADNINIVTPTEWDSTVTYGLGSIVRVSGIGFYYNPSQVSTNQNPVINSVWSQITSILSPFKTTSYGGYYLLDCDSPYGANQVAVVYSGPVNAMWEPVDSTQGAHVEGKGNIATGDFQHVEGKYNTADANKALIIGNGSDTDHRSNALTVDWSGNVASAGDITTGVTLNTTAQTLGAAINEISVRVPAPPSTNGTYTLSVTVSDGVPTYTWVSS